jgi:transposase
MTAQCHVASLARAIGLAVPQPGKAVALKSEVQPAVLALPRRRQQLVKFRTLQINRWRGLWAESGAVMGKGRAALDKAIPMRWQSYVLTEQVGPELAKPEWA